MPHSPQPEPKVPAGRARGPLQRWLQRTAERLFALGKELSPGDLFAPGTAPAAARAARRPAARRSRR